VEDNGVDRELASYMKVQAGLLVGISGGELLWLHSK